MNYINTESLTNKQFKRRFGVYRKTYQEIIEAVKEYFEIVRQTDAPRKRGRPPKLVFEDKILATLEYWREYRTYFHIATNFDVSESTICRVVHRTLEYFNTLRKVPLAW